MESHGKQGPTTLHSRHSSRELDFGDGKGVPCVQSAVHVGVCHGAEELGVFLAEGGGGDGVQRDFLEGRGIGLEDTIFLPFLLVFLLDGNEFVSLFSL
jgi:hypothetical protein